MKRLRCVWTAVVCVFLLAVGAAWGQEAPAKLKTRNVVLIVCDGLRWQEVFTGADKELITTDHGGSWAKPEYLQKTWWRNTPEERRAVLFPFLWSTVAARGQIFGNQTKGSMAHVTNPYAFSYPGYNEMLTGAADPRINSNEFGPNPNTTVFEWLNGTPAFRGQVSVFATWETFKDIFNQPRSHLDMHVGWAIPYTEANLTPREQTINELFKTTTRLDDEDLYDSFLQLPLLDYVKMKHPRVLFVGYGEADNWAHSGRYDLVLESAHGFDSFVEQLWNLMQTLPEYRDQTTFIVTADHGRGSGPEEWKEHGNEQKGSENIWLAVMGPDTRPLGERTNVAPVTQSQIAATLAAFLGQDYPAANAKAAPPVKQVLP
ncbi:MAG TPA: AP protein [Methylomirabilota bacterium]|nr:AP protein [Methylomirabilota bacterium]